MIQFKICITPLLAPSVRNMSSGSLKFDDKKSKASGYYFIIIINLGYPGPVEDITLDNHHAVG